MVQPALGIIGADPTESDRLATFFAEQGFGVQCHERTDSLFACLATRPPHLTVICSPSEDPGLAPALLRLLREHSRLPCVILGNRDEVSPVTMLEAGADDVLDRTLPLRAVLARIRAILRRAEWGLSDSQGPSAATGWRLLGAECRLLRPDGSDCRLTTAEFDLMQLLIQRRGRALDRDTIADAVFHRAFRAEDRTVDNLVLRLRRKLGPAGQDAIKTVRGAGYMFVGFREDATPARQVA